MSNNDDIEEREVPQESRSTFRKYSSDRTIRRRQFRKGATTLTLALLLATMFLFAEGFAVWRETFGAMVMVGVVAMLIDMMLFQEP